MRRGGGLHAGIWLQVVAVSTSVVSINIIRIIINGSSRSIVSMISLIVMSIIIVIIIIIITIILIMIPLLLLLIIISSSRRSSIISVCVVIRFRDLATTSPTIVSENPRRFVSITTDNKQRQCLARGATFKFVFEIQGFV